MPVQLSETRKKFQGPALIWAETCHTKLQRKYGDMFLNSVSRFLDKFDLPWVILALITILILVSTNSRKDFWRCCPVGIWTMVTGALLEQFFINNKFWVDHYIMIKVGELDLFVIIGPFFAIGFLLVRFLPENRLAIFRTSSLVRVGHRH